ncbi:MAG TPA: hypothetical protein DCY13_05635 [Verrucomicrobiales bacterium]|nr:hypothetical protein [Verrucomicrobiales bacterium]
MLVTGCGRRDHYVLDNGKSIEVFRHGDGRVRGIGLRNETGHEVLSVGIEYSGKRTSRVRFWDQDRKLIGDTFFSRGNISIMALPVQAQLETRSGPAGVEEKRAWTYKNEYVVYSEELKMDSDGRLLSKVVRGPYGHLLEEYPPSEQADPKQRP